MAQKPTGASAIARRLAKELGRVEVDAYIANLNAGNAIVRALRDRQERNRMGDRS